VVRFGGGGARAACHGGGTLNRSPIWNLMTGTATKYLLLAVNLGLGLLLMPFTVRHLGTSQYGLWMLVASLTAYFQLLDLGYGNGLVRHVADADARGDIPRINRLLSTFVIVYGGLGLLSAVGIAVLIATAVPRFPHLSAAQVRTGQMVLAILGIRIAVSFPMTVFGAATTARQRFALNNSVATAVALVNGAVTYIVLASGFGLLALVGSTTAVGLASYAAYIWTARRAFPELRIRLSSFDRSLVRDVSAFSLYLFIIDVAVQIGFNLDNVVVGAALGTSAVAVYAVILRLADYQRQVACQFNGLLFPIAVRLGAGRRAAALESMLVDGTRIALILITGVTVCAIGFAEPLLLRWMGPAFEAGIVPFYVLAITGIVLVSQGPLGSILLGTGHHRLIAAVSMGEALANILLSVVLVRRFGMLGVAIGTAVPVFVANWFVLLPIACREFGMTTTAFLRRVLPAPAAGVLPAVAVCVLLRSQYPPTTVVWILAEASLVGAVYLITVVTIGLERAVRSRYAEHVRRVLPGAAHLMAGLS
jgi:O-antigen/teichoic acid export membrane protein